MRVKFLFLVIPLLTAACASAPKTQNPNLRVTTPDRWTAAVNTEMPGDTLWWSHFGDPQLEELVTEALTYNYNLQIAAARLYAASAQARIAGAPLLPQAGLNFNAYRRRQNFIGFPIPGRRGVLTSISNSFGVSLDTSWEVDLWGRLGAQKSAALADLQASQADLRAAKLSLAGQTSKVWFAAIEARSQVELARATVENFRTSSQQVRVRYERGLRPSLDLRLSLSNVATAEATLQQRQERLDNVRRQLELLLGRYPAAAIAVGEELPQVPDSVPAGLPADLVARRPDLIAAERQLAAADARLAQARAALYPRVSLTSSGGTASNELSDLLNGDFAVWNLVSNLVQPLFQGGRLRAGVDLANAQSEGALALYAESALRAYAEVEAALADEGFLVKQQDALETAAEQALAARRLAEDRYASGLTDLITMLESQRRAFEAESQLLAVRRGRLDARIDLYLALGGGFVTDSAELLDTGANTP